MTWNILLPGPSLALLKERPPGEIVSVNAAIRHEIVPDFFCALDGPLALGARSSPKDWNFTLWDRLQRLRPPVWSDPMNLDAWREEGFGQVYGWDWTKPGIPWIPRGIKRTVFYAIQGALRHGATRIDLWGCDMQGEDYFDGPGDKWGSHRWQSLEGPRLYRLIDAAAEQGIRIARR